MKVLLRPQFKIKATLVGASSLQFWSRLPKSAVFSFFSLEVRYKEIRNNNKYSNYSIFDEGNIYTQDIIITKKGNRI